MELSRFRSMIQTASTLLSNGYVGSVLTKTVSTNALKGFCVPYLNCYSCPSALFSCPIGTFEHFMALHNVPYLLLSMLGAVGIAVGRMACGWACPFGFLQDLLHKVRSPKFRLPVALRYLKYGFLVIFVLLLPYLTGDTWFSKICPAGTLMAGLPWIIWNPTNPVTGENILPGTPDLHFFIVLTSLLGFLALFVFTRRPFCKAVCPLGAIFSFFNGVSLVRLKVAKDCDLCNWCEVHCPMDLNVPLELNSGECIRCLECTRCGHVEVITPFSKDVEPESETNV